MSDVGKGPGQQTLSGEMAEGMDFWPSGSEVVEAALKEAPTRFQHQASRLSKINGDQWARQARTTPKCGMA